MNEKQLYRYVKDNYIPDLKWFDGKFSKCDCYSFLHQAVVELKCRRRWYDTLTIEKVKYDALMLLYNKSGLTPLYICSTPKDIYQFNILKFDFVWEKKLMKKQTDFSDTRQIEKLQAMMPVSKAIIL